MLRTWTIGGAGTTSGSGVYPNQRGPEDLQATLQTLFNDLLGDPPNKHIEIDRVHCALRPKDPASSCHLKSSLLPLERGYHAQSPLHTQGSL